MSQHKLTSLVVQVTQVGIGGTPKADVLVRPLRMFTDGTGFAVILSGKAVVAVPTGANSVQVNLASPRRPDTDTRVCKLADLGIAKAAKPQPASQPVAVAAKARGPLTPKQQAVLAKGRAVLAAKRQGRAIPAIAKASPKLVEPKAPADLNTIGDLLLATNSREDILAFVQRLIARS